MAHPSSKNRLRALLANLADPPFADRRFWRVQLMVVVVVVVVLLHLGIDLAKDHGVITTRGFVWNSLLLVPVVYCGNVFGLIGSLGATLTGVALLVLEEMLTHHGATSLWGDWSIFVMVLVVAVLIGDRFEVERREREELARSSRRFRLAFENDTAGMAIEDLDGRLVDVNRSYCEVLGHSPDELLGQDLIEVTHPEDRLLTGELSPSARPPTRLRLLLPAP